MNSEDRMIVLKNTKFGESDLIVQALNRQGSKMVFIAKGALNSKKRFGGGVLQPTHYIHAHFHRSASENVMGRLYEAKIIEDFAGLRKSYDRITTALYFLEMIDKVSKEGVVDAPELFDLLGNALRSAEQSQTLSILKLHFQIRLLLDQGMMPTLNQVHFFLEKPIREHEGCTYTIQELKDLDQMVQRMFQDYLY